MANTREDEAGKSRGRPGGSRFSLLSWLGRRLGNKGAPGKARDPRGAEIDESMEKIGIDLTSARNVLEEDEREMIHGVVELGETMVREIMVPRVEIAGIEIGIPLPQAIETIKKTGHSRFPLYEGSYDDIRGIIHVKDLLVHMAEGREIDLVKIARKAYFIPENKMADELLREMKKKHMHIAIVVDEYGGTSGLVTMEDIIEEIVGEIEDEHDIEPPPLVRQSPGVYLVDGSLPVADLIEEAGLNLPVEEFETVGGLIYDLVGSLPEKGRSVKYHGLTFVVEEVEGQRIVKVKVVAPGGKSQATPI